MIMRLNGFAAGAAVALAMSVLPATSQAAPLAGSGVDLKAGATGSNVEKAAYRECWWRHGRQVCRWVGYRDYDDGYYDYGYYGPYYGFGPSIRFGGGHRFHGGGHHRHR
jgi:hypothetical protein